jgi:hypothetical protein
MLLTIRVWYEGINPTSNEFSEFIPNHHLNHVSDSWKQSFNLRRLIQWPRSSERTSVYSVCFNDVDSFHWPVTPLFFTTLFTTPTVYTVSNLCAINRLSIVFMLTMTDTFSSDIPGSHWYSPSTDECHRAKVMIWSGGRMRSIRGTGF